MEKFGARVGCSFQTIVRWEGGRAKINYLNLLKLLALAQEHNSITERIFANEIRSFGPVPEVDRFEAAELKRELARATADQLRDLKATLDQVQQLLQDGQERRAATRLRKIRSDLERSIKKFE